MRPHLKNRTRPSSRKKPGRVHGAIVMFSVVAPVGGLAQPDVHVDDRRVVMHDADHPVAQTDVFETLRLRAEAG